MLRRLLPALFGLAVMGGVLGIAVLMLVVLGQDWEDALFWIFAAIMIGSGLLVVTMKDIIRCGLAMIVCFGALAGIYVLIGSPMTVDATALPVRAPFLPWLSNALAQRLTREGSGRIQAEPGAPVRLPPGVTGFERDSQVLAIGASAAAPSRPGVFFLRRGDERVGALVVNPEREESRLDRLGPNELKSRFRAREVVATSDPAELPRRAFDASTQRPLQAMLLLLALACLVGEMVVVRQAEPRGLRRAAPSLGSPGLGP